MNHSYLELRFYLFIYFLLFLVMVHQNGGQMSQEFRVRLQPSVKSITFSLAIVWLHAFDVTQPISCCELLTICKFDKSTAESPDCFLICMTVRDTCQNVSQFQFV